MDINFKLLYSLILFGTFTCVLLGLIFFGFIVFNIRSPFFQFISFGIVGSVSFSLFQLNRFREAMAINTLLFIILFLASGSEYFLTHILYFVAVIFSVYIYSIWIFQKLQSQKYLRPLILSSLFSIIFVIVTLILTFIFYSETTKILPFSNMPIGFLIGFGLGIGFEVSEYLGFNNRKITLGRNKPKK